MDDPRWKLVAVAQAVLGVVGLTVAAAAADGSDGVSAWYGFGPAWLFLAGYTWRNRSGSVRDAPPDALLLLGCAVVAGIAGIAIGLG